MPEIVGGLVVAAVLALIGALYAGLGMWAIIVITAVGVWLGCAYLAFKRTPPLVEDGKGTWQYPRWRRWALAGLVIIPLLTASGMGYYLYQQAQPPAIVMSPTETPVPPTPTPMAIRAPSDLLANATIILDDPLDNLNNWFVDGDTEVLDGLLTAKGIGTWSTNHQISRSETIGENQGALVLFRFRDYPRFLIFIEHGDYGHPDYRTLSLHYGHGDYDPDWVISKVTYGPSIPIREFGPRMNTWYYLFFKVGQEGNMEAYFWERDRPVVQASLVTQKDPDRDNLSWRFKVHVHSGVVELDEYQELDFGE